MPIHGFFSELMIQEKVTQNDQKFGTILRIPSFGHILGILIVTAM